MTRRINRFARGVLASAALAAFLPSVAYAQRPPLKCEAQAPEGEPSAEDMAEARTRYERGQELYDDGAYEQALIEFDRAYALAPAHRILFNIGQVAVLLNNYPRAIEALEGYLCGGGDKIEQKRRAAVEKELDTLYGRIAYIEIATNVEGAEIIVDDISRGRTPLDKPIIVNAGRHTIVAKKAGLMEDRETVVLAGTDRVALDLELLEPPAGQPASPIYVTPPTRDDPGTPGAPPPKPPPEPGTAWIGWVTTGTLAAGAIVTGLLALKASSDLDDLKNTFPVSRDELDDQESQRLGLSVATDVLAGLAVVSAGVSIWWTISENDGDDEGDVTARVVVSPASVGIAGSF